MQPKYFCTQDGETQVGNDITNIEAVRFQLKTQFDRNVVTHFEAQEQVFDYVFTHLGIDTEGRVNHPVVMTEAFLNPNYSRHCKTLCYIFQWIMVKMQW
jgi:actin-related protein 5